MEITVYDSTGNQRVRVEVLEGDVLEWKPKGYAGSRRCRVLEVRTLPKTIKLDTGSVVPASSSTFLALYRDGHRLP